MSSANVWSNSSEIDLYFSFSWTNSSVEFSKQKFRVFKILLLKWLTFQSVDFFLQFLHRTFCEFSTCLSLTHFHRQKNVSKMNFPIRRKRDFMGNKIFLGKIELANQTQRQTKQTDKQCNYTKNKKRIHNPWKSLKKIQVKSK